MTAVLARGPVPARAALGRTTAWDVRRAHVLRNVVTGLPVVVLVVGLVLKAASGGRSTAADGVLFVAGAAMLVLALVDRRARHGRVVGWTLPLLAVYGVSAAVDGSSSAYGHMAALVTCIGVLAHGSAFGHDLLELRSYRVLLVVGGAGTMIGLVQSSAEKNFTAGASVYALAMAHYALAVRAGGRLTTVLAVALTAGFVMLALFFDFRALLPLSLVYLGAFAARRLQRGRAYTWVVGVALVAALLVVYGFFVAYERLPFGSAVNHWLREHSGRGALSGRQELWPVVTDLIGYEPVWGLGAGALPRHFLDTSLSAHNYYLQATLQTGLVGLACVVVLLVVVWWRLSDPLLVTTSRVLGCSVFAMFVVHNGTEVLMFQNALTAALPAWIVIGHALAGRGAPAIRTSALVPEGRGAGA